MKRTPRPDPKCSTTDQAWMSVNVLGRLVMDPKALDPDGPFRKQFQAAHRLGKILKSKKAVKKD